MSVNKSSIDKSRYWFMVLYVENMIDSWEDLICDVLQVPFSYCVHDMDTDSQSEHRKDHVHLLLAFSNTTTWRHALAVSNLLSAPGKVCCSTGQAAISVRSCYDYEIHDTETCRKLGKYQYPPEARVCGNNFDIGLFEQLSVVDRVQIVDELCCFILDECLVNFSDFYELVKERFGDDFRYLQLAHSYSGLLERLTRSNYQRVVGFSQENVVPSQAKAHEKPTQKPTQNYPICCPVCGSVHFHKAGKTRAGSSRLRCNDCGKKWTLD